MQMVIRDDEKGIDLFVYCIMIVFVCNLVFWKLFLEEKFVGIILLQGYRLKDKQLVKVMQWMKYYVFKKMQGFSMQVMREKGLLDCIKLMDIMRVGIKRL